MTQNINTDCIERFMARVRQAHTARSKDIRLTIDDAQELSGAMGQLLARLIAFQDQELSKQEVITISLDGGQFDG